MSRTYFCSVVGAALGGAAACRVQLAWAPPTPARPSPIDPYSDVAAIAGLGDKITPNDAYDMLFGSASTQGVDNAASRLVGWCSGRT